MAQGDEGATGEHKAKINVDIAKKKRNTARVLRGGLCPQFFPLRLRIVMSVAAPLDNLLFSPFALLMCKAQRDWLETTLSGLTPRSKPASAAATRVALRRIAPRRSRPPAASRAARTAGPGMLPHVWTRARPHVATRTLPHVVTRTLPRHWSALPALQLLLPRLKRREHRRNGRNIFCCRCGRS